MLVKKLDWNNKITKTFLAALLSLRTEIEMQNFLKDVLTEKEVLEFSYRLLTAQMISQGITYKEIEKETGFSSRTIARVATWLNGDIGGYRSVIAKLNHHHKNKSSA